jgi:formate hydrogenlyase subunit 3/multisubunit Na+/H+ antiporter MnhD subunit
MWMSHHLWHENITFLKLSNAAVVGAHLQEHYTLAVFISIMILLAAVIKSAQLPFSSWLPRAMEGPTTSSAIFYGSLSVHLGVFVLLRTAPLWENVPPVQVLIIAIGLATAVIATAIARVQSTVKTQIAYSSAAQIGIIFIEVGLGLHLIALIHFAGNAFLRTYQLLVSPSVLSYLTHDQFYNFTPRDTNGKFSILKRISNSFYILSIKEWNMDTMLHRLLWNPFKWMGKKFEFVTRTVVIVLVSSLFLFGLFCFSYNINIPWAESLPYIFASLALILILSAFTDRGDAKRSWLMVFASQFFVALAIGLNTRFDFAQILIYLSGGTISALIGYACLHKIKELDQDIDLNKFHGYVYKQPTLALIFLFSCLGLVAFPITPAFIGFDILLTHIHHDQFFLIGLAALSFIFIELSVLRIYARIFLGQPKNADHAMAFRSS